jgi:hypothetical protein
MESSRRDKPDYFLIEARNKLSNNRRSRSHDPLLELECLVEMMKLEDVDDDLLDRAERRDLPTKFQLMKTSPQCSNGSHKRIKSKAESAEMAVEKSFSIFPGGEDIQLLDEMTGVTKAPPVRRSAIPDLLEDDLAFRRLHRSHSNDSSQAEKDGRESSVMTPYGFPSNECYMLYNRAFTPVVDTLPALHPIYKDRNSSPSFSKGLMSRQPPFRSTQQEKELDSRVAPSLPNEVDSIELDDVCYRKYLRFKSTDVAEPPFGIPRSVVPASTPRHYLNIFTHDQSGNPIIHRFRDKRKIFDDLAVRSLRKDQPNDRTSPPLFPPTTFNILNQKNLSKSSPCLKSLIPNPVTSPSAGGLIHRNRIDLSHQSRTKVESTAVNESLKCHHKSDKQGNLLNRVMVSVFDVDEKKNRCNKQSNPSTKRTKRRESNEDRQQEDFLSCKSSMFHEKRLRQQLDYQDVKDSKGKEINHFCLKSENDSFCPNDESAYSHQDSVSDVDHPGDSRRDTKGLSETSTSPILSNMIDNILRDMRKRDIFGSVDPSLVKKTQDFNHNIVKQS